MGDRQASRTWRRGAVAAVGVLLAASGAGAGASPVIRLRACLGERVTITGTAEADRLRGTRGPDVIAGLGGDDVIVGHDGDDRICGGAGGDEIEGRYGDDLVDGGDGADQAHGGPGSDLLLGRDGNDRLIGGDGDSGDTLVGGSGGDNLFGGDGRADSDYLFGGDWIDTLDGGLGAQDQLYGGPGPDSLTGGLVSYEFATRGVVVDAGASGPAGVNAQGEGNDRLWDVDGAVGSHHDDVLNGGAAPDLLRGLDGDDAITSGEGDDRVDGGAGSDRLDGGAGRDAVAYDDSPVGVTASLRDGAGRDTADDSLTGFEDLFGSYFDDTLTGDDGPNVIGGSFARNALFALAGDDYLSDAAEGDAGEGQDTCESTGAVVGCELEVVAEYEVHPYVTHPVHRQDAERLGTVRGEAFGGGRSRVDVGIRRLTPEGCWWWDSVRRTFVRGVCGLVHPNEVRVRQHEWALRVDVALPPGSYLVVASWAGVSPGFACGSLFEPRCAWFDVR
ncbi:MAG TPA: calcium-binding protein [Actinomycetota bacterium]|nr:calcium-binding protein [Actinomycetota bacterium]